jgi:hypothetical protein
MKKKYIEPTLHITYVKPQSFICTSVYGVSGTGDFDTDLSDEETDLYLTRRTNVWDDVDENEDW